MFARDYGAKWPKAVAKITEDTEVLLCFFDFPAEHWLHLRTTDERFKGRCGVVGRLGRG